MMSANTVRDGVVMMCCGDVGPVHGSPESYADLVKPVLASADIRFGQCERVYSERGALQVHSGGQHSRVPQHMASVFTACGFDVVSLASNHSMDWGEDALLDTKALMGEKGILTVGAGHNLQEARKCAVIERNGVRVAFLAYSSVVREGYEAGPSKTGVAPLRIHTYYEPLEYQPGVPPKVVTIPYPEDMEALEADITAAKQKAHIVVLSLHWGIHFIPRLIADYQPLVAHAAFEAGADIIIGHHAHIPKAIEVYKGKGCFYSLSNFIMSTPLAEPQKAEDRRILFLSRYGAEMDPEYPQLPYGMDGKRSLVARAVLTTKGVSRLSFLPALIDKQLRPEFLRQGDQRFDDAVRYMEGISEGFTHRFSVEGDEVVVSEP